MHYALNPQTHPMPSPFIAAGDAEQLRTLAFSIEDAIGNNNPGGELVFQRPGLLFIRAALLELADRMDRD